jgi:hypothetical protein
MTNEEKAEQIAQYHCANKLNLIQAYNAALDMAEWKDEEHAKEKQQWIEKACEWLEPVFKDLAGYNCGGDLIEDFKQSMKGE